MMEPDVSIETSSMIRVAVIPIGTFPPFLLRDYVSLFYRHWKVELSAISSFYTEHQKSPFAHQPWDFGSLRFQFMIGDSPLSPWEDFQSNRKILVVIGLCHCPSSPDIDVVLERFSSVCKKYSSSLVQRCFAFFPTDTQLDEGSKKGSSLIMFPPADTQAHEFQLYTVMHDIAASVLMEFEKWVLQAESTGTILKTPLDSQASLSSEEVMKSKKRKLGRAQKTIGDYCLLAGSPIDANAHYSTAVDLARLTGDYFWLAGALEGSVCALLIDQIGKCDPALEEEVRYRYSSVILHYRKSFIQDNAQRVSPLSFELEAILKLARFLCRREFAKEVVELLTNAADGSRALIDASDRLVLYIEIARLFGSLGYLRKAAFFTRQVAQLYLQQDNKLAAISALQVLEMTTKVYRVQSRASLSKQVDEAKAHSSSVISLFESHWSSLQMVVLREILMSALRAGDPLTAWSAAARLLRSYYPLITPAGQNALVSSLNTSSDRLPPGTRCADPALPFIRLRSFPVHLSKSDIVKRDSSRDDWWAGSAPSGPFIYTPFSKEPSDITSQEIIWIMGEPIQVLVELANPCGFDLNVDSIYLFIESGNFDSFPISINLPPNSSKVVALSGIPTSVGPLTIPGCIVHSFGVITEHYFRDVECLLLAAAQGLVLSDPFRCCGALILKNIATPNISVVPPLPLLVSHMVGGDGAIILYEGEIRDICISLANVGTVPVDQIHISVSGKNQNSVVSFSYQVLRSALPLIPGAEVKLPVTLRAWQLGLADLDKLDGKNGSSRRIKQFKDACKPMLIIHYAGPSGDLKDTTKNNSLPPGRRLVVPLHVSVLQGLSFVKAQLLSMETPVHIAQSLPQPLLERKPPTGETSPSESEKKGLLRMDPYRGNCGFCFLELELSNPTDVVFEVTVSVMVDDSTSEITPLPISEQKEISYPKTRIDWDYSARVLIPLQHFKLPVLDDSFLVNGAGVDSYHLERNKAELNETVKNLISRIKVKWQSGRHSSGELDIRDATKEALRTSLMDVLLPDALAFGFRVKKKNTQPGSFRSDDVAVSKGVFQALEMTPMEVLVQNNTKEMVKLYLNITCRDVAGVNCIDENNGTVLWGGVLSGIVMEVPSLEETRHSFSIFFLVQGEYTLQAAAVVVGDPSAVLRARAKAASPDHPIFFRGPLFHVMVTSGDS